jgi:hypothetical protein
VGHLVAPDAPIDLLALEHRAGRLGQDVEQLVLPSGEIECPSTI